MNSLRPKILVLFFLSGFLCFISSAVAESTAKIGILIPLTGSFSDIGDDCRRGVEMAKRLSAPSSRVGVHSLLYVTEDSEGDPKVAVSAFKKLVDQDKVHAVITIRTPVGMALNPISKQKKVAVLGAVGHPEYAAQNEYAFQIWPSTVEEGRVLAEHMFRAGHKSVATITLEDDWTISLTKEFTRFFEERGGKVLIEESVLPTDTDLSTILSRVAFSAQPIDAVYINLGPAQGALAVKKLFELKSRYQIYSNFWSGDQHQISTAGIAAAEGLKFPEARLENEKFQAAALVELPKKRPSAITHACYSAAESVLQAISTLPGPITAEGVHESLLKHSTVHTVEGDFNFKDRRAQFDVIMKAVKSGKVEVIG